MIAGASISSDDVTRQCLGDIRPMQGQRCSIWDMINSKTTGLVTLIRQLALYHRIGEPTQADPREIDSALSEHEKKDVLGWLEVAENIADDFSAKSSRNRIGHFRRALGRPMTWRQLAFEAQALSDAFHDDLVDQWIYRYPDDKVAVLKAMKHDWKAVVEKFPSAQADILAAVDCYALGHGTASVFHCIRILEYGLKALANDVGVEWGVDSWQLILNKIKGAIKKERAALPRGTAKEDRLQFLAECVTEFEFFKEAWRNHVSHNKATYDEHQARSVMEHVRNFMGLVSARLSEEPDA